MSNRSNLKPSRKVVLYYREIDWSNLQHHQLALRNNHRLLTNIDQLPEKLKFLTLLPTSHMSNALVMFSRCGANQLLRGRVFTLERLPQQRLANQTKINPDLRRVPFRDRHLINIEVLTCWAIRMGFAVPRRGGINHHRLVVGFYFSIFEHYHWKKENIHTWFLIKIQMPADFLLHGHFRGFTDSNCTWNLF